MKHYIGVKEVNADPMTRGEYNKFRGFELWSDDSPDEDGYLVEYIDGGQANTEAFNGYVSWSPKEVFERAYRQIGDLLSFGDALVMLKAGAKVARIGWNGKGMWLSLSCDGSREVAAENFWSPHNADFALENGGKATVLPCITMKTADGSILMGWLASQTDMLAEDWVVVE